MSKSTLIAAIVFVALLGAALFTMQEKPERGITRVSFRDITPADVTRIVATGKNSYELRRTDQGWALADGRPVNTTAAQRLTEALPKIESSAVVTQNASRFEELEVDDENGTRIAAFEGDTPRAEFVVGKDGRNGAHVRVGDAVYSARGVYQSLFRRDENAWLEKKIFDLPFDQLSRIDVTRADGTTYALVYDDEEWGLEDDSVLPEGFRFDSEAAAGLGRAITNTRSKDVLATDPGDEETGLGGSVDRFVLTGGEEPLELRLASKDESDDAYARATGWDYVLVLPSHVVRGIQKTPLDFRDLTLMDFDPSVMTRVRIFDVDRELVFTRPSSEDEWSIESSTETEPDGFAFDPNKVNERLAAVAFSRAAEPAPDGVAPESDVPEAGIAASDAEGNEVVLGFFGEVDQHGIMGALARGNADDALYVAPTYARNNLTGGLASFATTTAPAGQPRFDPAQLQNLPPEVRQQLLRQMQAQQLQR